MIIMENELYAKFNKIGLNDKRNVFNLEMIKLFEIINMITNVKGYHSDNVKIINYDLIKDKSMSEDEYLFYQYQNLINIRKALINYVSWKE